MGRKRQKGVVPLNKERERKAEKTRRGQKARGGQHAEVIVMEM